MNRQSFIQQAAGYGLCLSSWPAIGSRLKDYQIRTLTSGPKHHFFGYYGINPWNLSGQYLLSLETDFQDHMPTADEDAGIILVDAQTGKATPVTRTKAWNFQQGCMLHWHPMHREDQFLYNDRESNEIVAVVMNLKTGSKQVLPRSVSGLGHRTPWALSLTNGRLTRMRKVVGYSGIVDPHANEKHPKDDGVFVININTGQHKLVVSIAEVVDQLMNRHPELREKDVWLDHTVFNHSDNRFLFLARTVSKAGLQTGMFTADRDGTNLREVIPYGSNVSHFEWRNDEQILATFQYEGATKHILFTDGKADYQVVGPNQLIGDGHCSFAPDQNRIVTDRNFHDRFEKGLYMYDLKRQQMETVGMFSMGEKKYMGGDLRCDLHPRWNADGTAICFDALGPTERTRQIHVATFG